MLLTKRLSICLFLICITSCTKQYDINNEKTAHQATDSTDTLSSLLAYTQLNKLSIHGDFDGDGTIDTIKQDNINQYTKISIDSFPDIDYDSRQQYFEKIDSDIILTFSHKQRDTLHLFRGKDLYCLINIGDNNNDKKDEIALVVDVCDFTNINTCHIYSYCNNHWHELKSFHVHEQAFYTTIQLPEIKGHLEYRNKKWMYLDYYTWFNAEKAKDTLLVPLKIKKCD